jgi:hypothetical protein
MVVLVWAAFPAIPSRAGDRFQPVSAEELAIKSEPQAPGVPAIILYRQVDRDDNGRTSHEDNYVRIKILTEEGRKYADVDIPFVKENGQVVNLKARTIRPDGSVVNFEGKVFEKSLVKARGTRYLAKTFTLPDVQPGSLIEYYYTYDMPEHRIFESNWILSEDLFTRRAVFSLKPYSSPYSRYSVRWSWQGLPPGTDPPKQSQDQVIRLDARNIPAFQTEDFMPPANELKARVDFIYSDDNNPPGADAYWKNLGKKRNEEMEHLIDKRNAMQAAAGQIVSPADPPEVKLQKIYARVQQMRNSSYEVRKTEQEEKREQGKNSVNVEDIWTRGYGTAIQLNWLYLALARAAQLEAYGVWVSSRANYFFDPQHAVDGSRLTANVVLAKANGTDIFCDPGSKFAPFGLLPWYETGIMGLRIDKDGGTWIKTPLPESSASRVVRKADLKLSDTGDLDGKLTMTFTGQEAIRRRSEERNEDETGRQKFLEDLVKRYIPATSEVALTNQPDWNNSATPLVAEFTLKVQAWSTEAGRRVLVPVGLFSALEKHLFDHAERVHPIYIEFPFEQIDDVTIDLPSSWQVGSLPPVQKQDGHIITYSMAVNNENGRLHVSRTLHVDFVLMERKYYTALRTFFQTVKSSDEQQIVLQPGTATATR